MFRSLRMRLGLPVKPLSRQQRLDQLQTKLSATLLAGRDECDGSTMALVIQADALLKQTDKPFEQRCGDVHNALAQHLANRLITRLDSYTH